MPEAIQSTQGLANIFMQKRFPEPKHKPTLRSREDSCDTCSISDEGRAMAEKNASASAQAAGTAGAETAQTMTAFEQARAKRTIRTEGTTPQDGDESILDKLRVLFGRGKKSEEKA